MLFDALMFIASEI